MSKRAPKKKKTYDSDEESDGYDDDSEDDSGNDGSTNEKQKTTDVMSVLCGREQALKAGMKAFATTVQADLVMLLSENIPLLLPV